MAVFFNKVPKFRPRNKQVHADGNSLFDHASSRSRTYAFAYTVQCSAWPRDYDEKVSWSIFTVCWVPFIELLIIRTESLSLVSFPFAFCFPFFHQMFRTQTRAVYTCACIQQIINIYLLTTTISFHSEMF